MNDVASPILEVKDLHAYIGGFHILQGVNFEAEEYKLTAILGRNGVGKTTTLKTIMGIYKAARGKVFFKGENITNFPTHSIVKRGISFVPAEKNVFANLTVIENLKLAYNGPKEKFDDKLEMVMNLFPELKRFSGLLAGELSGGQQRMLALACGLVREHDLLILDEPSEGLSPAYVKNFYRQLRHYMLENKKTILLIEQNFAYAREITDYIYLMDKGVVVTGFPSEKIDENNHVIRRILGVSL